MSRKRFGFRWCFAFEECLEQARIHFGLDWGPRTSHWQRRRWALGRWWRLHFRWVALFRVVFPLPIDIAPSEVKYWWFRKYWWRVWPPYLKLSDCGNPPVYACWPQRGQANWWMFKESVKEWLRCLPNIYRNRAVNKPWDQTDYSEGLLYACRLVEKWEQGETV